jgi:hypothetical protein
MSEFNQRCKLKKTLNNRLKADGYWDGYNELRGLLKASGVPENQAWRVAAYPFAPKDGSPPELLADPLYQEIEEGWKTGKYQLSDADAPVNGADAGSQKSADIQSANAWRSDLERLATEVGSKVATELEEVRWVIASYLKDPKTLTAAEVPSAAAVSILAWVKMSASNFGDFLRTHNSKLLPDKKALEQEARFVDDGRDLKLIDEFTEAFECEQMELRRSQGECPTCGTRVSKQELLPRSLQESVPMICILPDEGSETPADSLSPATQVA